MLDPTLFEKVLRRLLSQGGVYADIFSEHRKATSIHLEDSKIEKVVSGADAGVGIRLIADGKTSYGFTNDISEASLMELAGILSRSGGKTATHLFSALKKGKKTADLTIEQSPDTTPISRKMDLVYTADKTARSFDNRIRQVSVSYRDFIQKVQIATSEGSIVEDERVQTLFMLHVIASEAGVIQTGYETSGGHMGFELFDGLSIEKLALDASRRSLKMLCARRAPSGRMPVVISSEAGGTMIHEAIGHGLEADLVQYGMSVYAHKLGEQVASPLVTVIDDATLPHRRGSYRFDDEGVPSQRTVLVDKGTLNSYLYDRLAAARDNVPPTGNGRRESYRHKPIPRMSNTFIAPGDSAEDDIIKCTPRGLFVKRMGGGQVNTVTGDFVFEVQEGYTIEDGTIGEPVREATLSGNGPDVLKSIDMIASDLGFSIGTCGKDSQGVPISDAMPTLRIQELVVGGEVAAQESLKR